MNHRPPGLETVKAIQGFLQYKSAEGLSPRTIESYERDLQQWVDYQGEMDVVRITAQHLRQYLTVLLTEYTPRRLTGRNEEKLSPKTVRNVWVTLSAFFHWVSDEFQIPNPMKMVPAPKFEDPPVEPFTREQIESLLNACDFCQEARTSDRRKFTMHRVTGLRDKAIILVLLDSRLRASELCALRIGDYDPRKRFPHIWCGSLLEHRRIWGLPYSSGSYGKRTPLLIIAWSLVCAPKEYRIQSGPPAIERCLDAAS